MADDTRSTSGTDDDESLEQARAQEELHRRLQQQGESGDTQVPPRVRERHDAIDDAVEDVERSVRRAHARRPRS